jgi:hypothetical protein
VRSHTRTLIHRHKTQTYISTYTNQKIPCSVALAHRLSLSQRVEEATTYQVATGQAEARRLLSVPGADAERLLAAALAIAAAVPAKAPAATAPAVRVGVPDWERDDRTDGEGDGDGHASRRQRRRPQRSRRDDGDEARTPRPRLGARRADRTGDDADYTPQRQSAGRPRSASNRITDNDAGALRRRTGAAPPRTDRKPLPGFSVAAREGLPRPRAAGEWVPRHR